jgi:hypothetical protein
MDLPVSGLSRPRHRAGSGWNPALLGLSTVCTLRAWYNINRERPSPSAFLSDDLRSLCALQIAAQAACPAAPRPSRHQSLALACHRGAGPAGTRRSRPPGTEWSSAAAGRRRAVRSVLLRSDSGKNPHAAPRTTILGHTYRAHDSAGVSAAQVRARATRSELEARVANLKQPGRAATASTYFQGFPRRRAALTRRWALRVRGHASWRGHQLARSPRAPRRDGDG